MSIKYFPLSYSLPDVSLDIEALSLNKTVLVGRRINFFGDSDLCKTKDPEWKRRNFFRNQENELVFKI